MQLPPTYQRARDTFGPGMHRVVPHLDDFKECLRLVLHDDRKRLQVVRLFEGSEVPHGWSCHYFAPHRMPYATRASHMTPSIAFPSDCPHHVREAILKATKRCPS